MIKVSIKWPFIAISLLALFFIPAANATLSPIAFGFPTMAQFSTSTAFNKAIVNAFDFESADISPFGSSFLGFPTVSQSAVQGQAVFATDFSQNTVFSAYSYPAVDTGLGFAGFDIPGFGDLLL
jgi:hypothetical protein